MAILAALVAVAALAWLRCSPTAHAQDPWEYTPYRVQIWLTFENAPELPVALRADIERRVLEESEAIFGATWDLQIAAPPARFSSELLYRLDQFPIDDLVTAAKLGKQAQPPKPKPPGASDGSAGGTSVAGSSGTTPSAPSAPTSTAPSAGKTSEASGNQSNGAPAAGGSAPSSAPMPAPGSSAPGSSAPGSPAPPDATPSPAPSSCVQAQDGEGASSAAADSAAPMPAQAAPTTAENPGTPATGNSPTGNPATGTPATGDGQGAPASEGASVSGGGNPGSTSSSSGEGGAGGSSSSGETTGEAPKDPVVEQLRAVFKSDKLLVASVRVTMDGWKVSTREMDVRSRRWSSLVEWDIVDRELLPYSVAAALRQTFHPIARIDYQKDKSIMLRLRAAGLTVSGEDPVLVAEQSFLRPWVRHNDRYGEPRPPLGVQTIPFSFLMVQKRDGSRLECDVHTGVRFPLTGRNTARTERFALAVRPNQTTTLVRLRTNEKPPQPLSGYDIYAKDPRNENVELIGRTDWRGTMEVGQMADFPLRVIYVKNGNSLLARLPTIPGLESEMQVDLTPDDRRLQAEGFVAGVQAVLTDLVAQRELYAKRIRNKLTENKIIEAEQLLEEFKTLQTRDDVQKLLDQQQPRLTSPHKKVQAKIDKLFEDTRKLLYKFVDPALANKLEDEVKQTREGKGPYAAAAGVLGEQPPPAAPAAPPTPPAPPTAP